MRILLASAELYPYSKTGGLADMVAALGKSLARARHQVGIVTPLYRGLRERFPEIQPFDWRIDLPLDGTTASAGVWIAQPRKGLTIYFIDHAGFYQRAGYYQEGGVEYGDNPERFGFLSKCVAHLARYLPWRPELVHVHDWHVGLAPLLIRHQGWREGWLNAPRTCLTIHNLAYQGNYAASKYELTNLPPDYFHPGGAEFYGQFSFLKTAISYADAITTVSPRYAREIATPEFGHGLDGAIRARQDILTGILNGVDYDEWRTTRNPHLPFSYTPRLLTGKARNKRALQEELGLPTRADVPLFGTIARLAYQKGMEIQLPALEEMLASELQFVLLGSGQPEYEAAFLQLAQRHPDKAAVRIGYDHGLSHHIEAGCDFFLMPSLFEPCGLNQMYSQRYGTIPIVRAVGGLDDSVVDARQKPEKADGIKFHEYSAAALAKAMRKAVTLFHEREALAHYRRNAMAASFSWHQTTAQYLEVYRRALDGKPSK